jgi:fructose-1,6-bisphosphatase/inositol monophosphatase family enzyme
MIDGEAVSEVGGLIRAVARSQILPRFGRLAAGDVAEKAPGDLVTVADRAAEEALSARLTALLPGSRVVGEEAVAADPSLLRALDGPEPVWIVDPIDGTENFVHGSPRFSTLVALASGGRLLASWTYIPVFGTMATATAGGGAFVDGRRVRVRAPRPGPGPGLGTQPELRHLDVVVSQPRWWTPQERARVNALAGHQVALSYLDTSGIEYVELASGRRSAMVLTWELPWDHAAGLLLHAEAGGAAATADGSPFRLSGGNRLPFVAAPDAHYAAALNAALALPVTPAGAYAAF